MPSKKKKYNARFPAGRIKKIMQSDEEVGKVAQAVPIIISRTLELFVESLLEKTLRITNSRNAKTLSPSHMKQCIMAESRFDFLRELVKNIPDISVAEEIAHDNSPGPHTPNTIQSPFDLSLPSTSCGTVIQTTATNGSSSLRNNGVQINTPSPNTQRTTISTPKVYLRDLKRSWESTNEDSKSPEPLCISANFYKENSVIQHTSEIEPEASPAKLFRMDSAPPVSQATYSLPKNSIRKLQHQSKSIPCTSSKEQPKTPVTPAPILNIDVCNRPIVKIDYSNLALHNTDTIECTAMSENRNIAASTCMNPVINIDLSKIKTTPPTKPTVSLQSMVTKALAGTSKSSSSTLDLDEDYDNI